MFKAELLYPDIVCERNQALVSPSRTYKIIIPNHVDSPIQ